MIVFALLYDNPFGGDSGDENCSGRHYELLGCYSTKEKAEEKMKIDAKNKGWYESVINVIMEMQYIIEEIKIDESEGK